MNDTRPVPPPREFEQKPHYLDALAIWWAYVDGARYHTNFWTIQ